MPCAGRCFPGGERFRRPGHTAGQRANRFCGFSPVIRETVASSRRKKSTKYLSPETVCRVRREQASGIRINRDGTIRSPENGFHRLSVPERECRACTVIRFPSSVRFWYVCPALTEPVMDFSIGSFICDTAAIFCITKKRLDDDTGCLSRYPADPVPARGARGRHAVLPGRVNTFFRRAMLLSVWFMSASGFGFFIVRQGGRLAGIAAGRKQFITGNGLFFHRVMQVSAVETFFRVVYGTTRRNSGRMPDWHERFRFAFTQRGLSRLPDLRYKDGFARPMHHDGASPVFRRPFAAAGPVKACRKTIPVWCPVRAHFL